MSDSPQRSMAPGTMIDDRHRVDEVLGQGGFATVYRGTDVASGRIVAIKVLDEGERISTQSRARFEREVHAVARLRDPHTVRLFTHGKTSEGTPFIVFELVPGRDLEQVLDEHDRLEPALVAHILRQVLLSLREAHQLGVMHRDIKPANIRVFEHAGDPWTVKVLDFGIARFADPQDARLTKTGELLGTPRYMSPEQLLSQPLGPPSDIYSIGIVAVEMLLGSHAMHGHGWSDQLDRLQSGHLFATSGEHSHLQRVIERMTSRDPAQRFQSVEAVLHALDHPDEPRLPSTDAPPTPPRRHLSEPETATRADGPRVNVWWALAAIVPIALAALIYVFAEDDGRPADSPEPARRNVAGLLAGGSEPPKVVASSSDLGRAEADAGGRDDDAADGCGDDVPWHGVRKFAIEMPGGMLSAPQRRSFSIYLPRDYAPDSRHPILLLFQTMVLNADDFVRATAAYELADRENVVVVTFDKINETDPFADRDLPFVRDALQDVHARVCGQRGRVFAFGHGKGAGFARRLACDIPLAGIATAGDWVERASPCHDDAVAHIKFAGRADPYARFDGGKNCLLEGPMWSVARVEQDWREKNGCAEPNRVWSKKRGGKCSTWTCSDASFVSCHIDGGHFFPGHLFEPPNPPFVDCRTAAPTFPIVETMWEFFEAQPSVLPVAQSDGE